MWSLVFLFLPVAATADFESPGWKALLHYEAGRSNVKEGSFFLSPLGHMDPKAEWDATQKLFQADEEGLCRYPARAIYFGLKAGTKGPLCERWQRWRAAVSPEGVELVFAAAFLNSPSSMYGHTLLKFPRAGKTSADELLDYTLNYGADTGSSAGFSYVWNGLTGGFDGNYATAPFYLKVKEYNFVENRDFWIYPLNVTPEELELLLAHAWELREVDFPYFFLRKNCSYYLLEFLEVARPGQGLVDSFPFWAVPMDTIRRLQDKGWLGEGRLRPSRQKYLSHRKKGLSAEEISKVSALLDEDVDLPLGREAAIVDAAYDLWRYRTEGKKNDDAVERRLLNLRRQYGASEVLEVREVSPDKGHSTSRMGLSYGFANRGSFAELSYRVALHDLLSNSLGYEPSSELSMGDLRLRWQSDRLFLERIDVLRLRSLGPYEAWFPRTAWSFRLGAERKKEMECEAWRCLGTIASGGAGLSLRVGPLLVFGLGELDAEWAGVFEPDYRISVGPTAGIFSPLWSGGRVLAEGQWRIRLLGEKRQKRSLKVGLNQDLHKSWEIRVEGIAERSSREALLKVHHYF